MLPIRPDSISKGDRVKVIGGSAFQGQSGIAMEDNFGRYGMVSVQFEGYPKPRRIEASRVKVTRHDPTAPQVVARHVAPTYIGPVGIKQPVGAIRSTLQRLPGESDADFKARILHNGLRSIIQGIKTSKDKALAARQALVQSFPTQEDRDQEEAIIHTRAHRFTELRKARLTVAYWK